MASVIINGRRMEIPQSTTADELKEVGGIKNGRNLIHRRREGNFVVRPGSKMNIKDGDVFVDAPPRTKG